eukprot:TRINITY_DN3529_c0_g1_i1.p1 TRINITY_DN3529_c0_g1~~TRINITY_DN3529_c0_g1_i1.p1  ORF type:complete len:481 (+),score=133.18 TRINITY_DN3529_c0_g1_i1:102-1445(+)
MSAAADSASGRSIGRAAALGHSRMRQQGENPPPEVPPEERLRVATQTFRTANQYFPEPGQEGVGEQVKGSFRHVLPSKEPRLVVPLMPDAIVPIQRPRDGVPPRGQNGRYECTLKGFGRPRRMKDHDFVDPADRFDAQVSTTGRVPGGLPDSRGFIETLTEQQRRQAEALSEDTLDAFRKGRERELDIERQRHAIKSKPFETPPVDTWVTTQRADYVNLLPAVDRSAADSCHQKPRSKPNKSLIERELSTREKPKRDLSDHAGAFRERDEAITDQDALKATRIAQTEALRQQLEKAQPKSAAWVGGPPRSTYKDHLREFDVKECEAQNSYLAKDPVVQGKHRTMDEETEGFIATAQQRKQARNSGDYATTASDTLKDRTAEAEPTTFRRAHYFERKGDTVQMPKRGDAPLRKPHNLHDTQNMTDVVPQHFQSTKDFYERMAAAGVRT